MTTLRLGTITLGKYILSIIMCFLIFFSFAAIFTMTSAEVVGYSAVIVEPEETYTHLYSDGTDTKKAEAEAQGYTVNTVENRELSEDMLVASHIISQIISLVLFVALLAKTPNTQGRSDRNAVNCGRMEKNLLRGFMAGLFPAGVSFIAWVCLLLAKFGVFAGGVSVYRYVNYSFFGYQTLIFGGTTKIVAESLDITVLLLALLPTVLILAVCSIAYILGYKDISLYEKAVYKK